MTISTRRFEDTSRSKSRSGSSGATIPTSVLAFTVSARTHEFSVRLAVGAAPRQPHIRVLHEGAQMARLGTSIGPAGGLALARLAVTLFPAIRVPGPTLVGVAATVVMMAAVLTWLRPSARRGAADAEIRVMTPTTHDFRSETLNEVAHRPWPIPDRPWIMTQTWRRLLFVHWPIAPAALRSHVPAALPIDTFCGDAWLSVAAFEITNIAPRGMPALPWLSAFPEVNVRTYVTVRGRPGVYFFSLDAGSFLAVWAARLGFHLPYYCARIRVADVNGAVVYSSRRRSGPERFEATYKPVSAPFIAEAGTLDEFLVERYCLHAITRGAVFSVDIHHPPWPLQRAEADIRLNTLTRAFDGALGGPAHFHYAARLDVVNWAPRS